MKFRTFLLIVILHNVHFDCTILRQHRDPQFYLTLEASAAGPDDVHFYVVDFVVVVGFDVDDVDDDDFVWQKILD